MSKGRTYFERFDTSEVVADLTVLDNKAISLLVQYVFFHGKGNLPAAGISGGIRYALEAPTGGSTDHPVDLTLALGLAFQKLVLVSSPGAYSLRTDKDPGPGI